MEQLRTGQKLVLYREVKDWQLKSDQREGLWWLYKCKPNACNLFEESFEEGEQHEAASCTKRRPAQQKVQRAKGKRLDHCKMSLCREQNTDDER